MLITRDFLIKERLKTPTLMRTHTHTRTHTLTHTHTITHTLTHTYTHTHTHTHTHAHTHTHTHTHTHMLSSLSSLPRAVNPRVPRGCGSSSALWVICNKEQR